MKLVRTTVGKDLLLWVIFAALALTTAVTQSEIVWLFILSGFIAMLIKAPLSLARFGSMFSFAVVTPTVDRNSRRGGTGNSWRPIPFFLKSGRVRIRQRFSDRPFSLWRGCRQVSLADRCLESMAGCRSGHIGQPKRVPSEMKAK